MEATPRTGGKSGFSRLCGSRDDDGMNDIQNHRRSGRASTLVSISAGIAGGRGLGREARGAGASQRCYFLKNPLVFLIVSSFLVFTPGRHK